MFATPQFADQSKSLKDTYAAHHCLPCFGIEFRVYGGGFIVAAAGLGVGGQFLWWATRAMFAMPQFADQSNLRKITKYTYASHHCLLWY